jgi:hypothetical protein
MAEVSQLDIRIKAGGIRGMLLVLGGLSAAIVLVVLAMTSTARGRVLLARTAAVMRHFIVRVACEIRDSTRIYCSRPAGLAAALLLTLCCQATFITGLYLAGRDLGIPAPAKYYYIFFPLSWVVGSLPVSIGGLGIIEGWIKLSFGWVPGVTGEQALVLALTQRLVYIAGSLPGAPLHLLGMHEKGDPP